MPLIMLAAAAAAAAVVVVVVVVVVCCCCWLQVDRRLNRCLKEMATVRKRERRMTLMSTKVKSVKREGQAIPECRSFNALSPIATSSARGQPLYLHTLSFTASRVRLHHVVLELRNDKQTDGRTDRVVCVMRSSTGRTALIQTLVLYSRGVRGGYGGVRTPPSAEI